MCVSEGSGGHLIPALEVSRWLASSGSRVTLLYADRAQAAALLHGLLRDAAEDGVEVRPLRLRPLARRFGRSLWRLGQAVRVWRDARHVIRTIEPDVVVGFGGWVSVPVIVAAKQAKRPVLLHEQNVRLGRANRFLSRWADRVALSFPDGRAGRAGLPPRFALTGLPIRPTIGSANRIAAARAFGLNPEAWTVLILGGSQGSSSLNHAVIRMLDELSDEERRTWQFIHLCGTPQYADVKAAYAARQARGWVAPHLADMAVAYAAADLVVARAGASTLAELARCGSPAILIPYPFAGAHQRDNARAAEGVGGAIRLEEAAATPARMRSMLRQLFLDERLRRMMGEQMKRLAQPDATQRLAQAILGLVSQSRAMHRARPALHQEAATSLAHAGRGS